MGSHLDYKYLMNGIEGVTSVIGHTPTDSIRRWVEQEAIYPNRIWTNQKKNVYCIDCGNGLRGDRYYIGSRLAALCLETKEEFYV